MNFTKPQKAHHRHIREDALDDFHDAEVKEQQFCAGRQVSGHEAASKPTQKEVGKHQIISISKVLATRSRCKAGGWAFRMGLCKRHGSDSDPRAVPEERLPDCVAAAVARKVRLAAGAEAGRKPP